ncbi:hypothetical protein M1555_04160 [Patescibacteria group bacterium]|nr:hypothetical protein [Patescibacteria group bacterium]
MSLLEDVAVASVRFGKNSIGLVTRPYETYRTIMFHSTYWELPYIGALLAVYFGLAAAVRTASFRPFLLTRTFLWLAGMSGISFLFASLVLWMAAKLVGGRGGYRSLSIGWAYTLLPTVSWFFVTSLLYVLLPPPRTTSMAGIAFSLVFLVFSVTILSWKVLLTYLTLRFSMKLDLLRIVGALGICLPVFAAYSYLTYTLGIFKVPFL